MRSRVSVEVPVFKHAFLSDGVRSVLAQRYTDWHLYLLSDGASWRARRVMRRWAEHPKISARFEENAGIGPSRRKLSAWSDSEFILTLDDDDILLDGCIEEMVACMDANPRAGIVRARRIFVDRKGRKVDAPPWFPFEPRKMFRGMTCDVHNHSQPVMIRRSAYEKTQGWFGFPDFKGAGEDCDIFLKIEEVADIVLLDRVLYGYRLHRKRFSEVIGGPSAGVMWKRLADMTIERRGLKLRRLNDIPPFEYGEVHEG